MGFLNSILPSLYACSILHLAVPPWSKETKAHSLLLTKGVVLSPSASKIISVVASSVIVEPESIYRFPIFVKIIIIKLSMKEGVISNSLT